MTRRSVIIVGGGLAGLSCAWHLVQSNIKVTLIERASCGGEATTKAAGMITPASEVHLGEHTLMRCFLNCADYYKSFANLITNNHPEHIDYQNKGSLLCAIDHNGKEELLRLTRFQRDMGLNTSELTKDELNDLEPHLTHKTVLAYFAKDEAHLDTAKLVHCLKSNLIDSGLCQILENRTIESVTIHNECLQSLSINDPESFTLTADQFILTQGLGHLPAELRNLFSLPLRAVKGQVLTVKPKTATLQRPVRLYHRYPIYLVPRADGRVVVGATSEEFSDTDNTAGGLMDLIYASWQALPDIYDAPVTQFVAGLRPALPDHKPVWGHTPLSNTFILNGLYRHGIMASPYLAKQLVRLMNDNEPEMNLSEFNLNRFNRSPS